MTACLLKRCSVCGRVYVVARSKLRRWGKFFCRSCGQEQWADTIKNEDGDPITLPRKAARALAKELRGDA